MKRFFSDDSFWNTPIAANPQVDPDSDRLVALLAEDDPNAFGINLHQWTIPVYEVDASTPRRQVHRRMTKCDIGLQKAKLSEGRIGPDHWLGHFPGFGPTVPIPDQAEADPREDSHLALVDWQAGIAWDMWAARKRDDGQWESNTGMVYRVDGPGVFAREDFPIGDGESIHMYGPSRAAGVPAIAGLIMHHEILAGKIEHKLACATGHNAFKQFTHPPVVWTDGHLAGGLPEGCVMQLDPQLDLDRFDLSPAARIVARASQEYGMVNVDNAGGNALYGEGLWAKPDQSWHGLLEPESTFCIPLDCYRVLKMDNIIHQGQGHKP
jgi:hypothetical protein